MSLFELQRNVLREFCVEEGLFVAALSYWPPSNLELATGIKTPPRTSSDDFVDDSGMGFVTPLTCKPKGTSKLSSCASKKNTPFVWSATSKWSSCSTQKEAPFVTAEDCNPKVSGGSSSHCFVTREGPTDAPEEAPEEARRKIPTSRVVNGEDVEFVREVERVEEVINCGSVFRHEEVLSGKNVLEDAVDEVDERDVRPRGYDKDFWSPLLNDDYGGNVNSRYSSKNLAKMVTSTAMAYRIGDYRDLLSKVRSQRSECGVYLSKIGVAHWSRANFPGDRYNIMTSNIAEQLNHALVEGRTSPIMELVIFIQRMMTRWFSARRKKAENHRGTVSVEVDKVMTNNMATMKGSKVNSSTEWSCEIIGKYVWECVMRLWLIITTRRLHGGRHMLG
ncbi:unnamed protein product [Brassica rapa]|uniref:Uncharacterized protein n=1 Tax=Brassica campestris TaxID=3711 RepID=A0A8D9LU15_BRACM|nr:unnamed protein product [Brassica rapa]CAG7906266.1 unnamed protein product [Brassica rapa]